MTDDKAPAPTSVRFRPAVKDGLVEWADAQDRALSWAINHACEHFLDRQPVEREDPGYDVHVVRAEDIRAGHAVRVDADIWRVHACGALGEGPNDAMTFSLADQSGQIALHIARLRQETMYQVIFRGDHQHGGYLAEVG